MNTPFLSITAHKHIPRILGLGLFLQQLDAMILNTAIPQMSVALATSPLSLKLAITCYLLTLAMFTPVSGFIADRFGSKPTLLWALGIFMLGSVMCGFAHSLLALIVGRLVQGIGGAMITPVGRLVLLKSFSRSDFLMAFTAYTLIGQVGLVMGPILGGILTTFVDWRWIFFVNIPVVLMALYWVRKHVPNHYESKTPDFDWTGFVIFGLSAGMITFAFSLLTEENFTYDLLPLILLPVGALLGIGYYFHAKRKAHPSLDVRIFNIRTFTMGCIGGTLFRLANGGFGFLLPLQLQIEFGYSAFQAGLMLLPNALVFMSTKTIFKKIAQRYGFKKPMVAMPLFAAVFYAVMALNTQTTPIWWMTLVIMAMGFFSSLQYSFMNTFILGDVPTESVSRGSSVSAVIQQLGGSFAVCFIAGLLVSSSHFTRTPLLSGFSFQITFFVLAATTLLTSALFLFLKPQDGHQLLKKS